MEKCFDLKIDLSGNCKQGEVSHRCDENKFFAEITEFFLGTIENQATGLLLAVEIND